MYERLAVCMWASVSMRRAALCAASVSSWGGTVRNARVLHVACRFAKTARLRATSFAWGLRRPAICGGLSWSRRRLPRAAPAFGTGAELSYFKAKKKGHHKRLAQARPITDTDTIQRYSATRGGAVGLNKESCARSDAVWRGRFRRELDAVARRTDRVAPARGAAVRAGAGVRRKLGHRAPGAGSSRLLQCGRGSFGGPARYTPQRAPGPTPRPAPVRGRPGSCTLFPPTSLTGGAGPAPVLEPRDGALTTLHRIVVVRLQFERLLLVDADGPGGGGVRLLSVGRLAV